MGGDRSRGAQGQASALGPRAGGRGSRRARPRVRRRLGGRGGTAERAGEVVVTVRVATPADVPAMARMAAELVRLHHGWDPRRFMLPEEVERGYAWWFGQEIVKAEVVM